ncbi:hypothetical protein MMON_55320 [Mycolicibacterium monacense]|uniref:Uncharacterized protein n=1 Tax=Mycolicibacterium monacense TaxID=85693 RepID=A0AAD1J4D7_MYCMB|nr:hypothetical protein MMON_55320 [Mycolicibacterium monacense]
MCPPPLTLRPDVSCRGEHTLSDFLKTSVGGAKRDATIRQWRNQAIRQDFLIATDTDVSDHGPRKRAHQTISTLTCAYSAS